MERNYLTVIGVCLYILTSITCNDAAQSDIDCLRSVKASLKDPENLLSSWDFSNITEGFICRFTGIECWNPDENRVLNIQLSDMGLTGEFPIGLKNCTSMTGLDLSNNRISGPLPTNMADIVQFLTILDLSSNNLSGTIPVSVSKIVYLNVLKLDNNRFTGQIPSQLGGLSRIREFNVSNNLLSGPVPNFGPNRTFTADSYAGNPGLCGGPLPPC